MSWDVLYYNSHDSKWEFCKSYDFSGNFGSGSQIYLESTSVEKVDQEVSMINWKYSYIQIAWSTKDPCVVGG